MPTKTVTQVLDSFDGKELDSDTRPIILSVDRRQWTLYLSEANAKKFSAQIEKWTENETESTAPTPSAGTRGRRRVPSLRSAPNDLGAIREWAREHGYEVAERGRISAEVQEAYRAAHG